MMDNETLRVMAVVVLSYLLGSIPTAYLVAGLKNINIFEVGSGNMGATNVVRAIGFRWGAVVLLIDTVKGALAIFIARQIMSDSPSAATTIAAIVAIVGHNWSLFATLVTGTLRGGKGGATAFGTLLMIAPAQLIVAMVFLFGLIVMATRYVSLGVLVAFAIAIVWLIVLINQQQLPHEFLYYSLSVAALILIRFRENIQRLLEGRERRFGERV